jgi:hypothetical protein
MQRRSSSTASGRPRLSRRSARQPPGSMPSAARPLTGRSRVVTSAVSSAPSTANSPGPVRARRAAPSVRTVYVRLPSRRPARTCGPGPPGSAGHQHVGSPVDGVLAAGAAACTGVGREYRHVGPGQQRCDITAEAASRSQTAASAPTLCTSAAWAGFLISPAAWLPRSARRHSNRSAIFPCPPAITMRVPPAYLPGSPADATTTPAGRAPIGKGLLAHRAPGSRAGLQAIWG